MALQFREIALNDVPDLVQIDAQVVVNDNVPKRDDAAPVDLRVRARCVRGQPARRFRERVKIAQDSVLCFTITEEEVAAIRRILLDKNDALTDVDEVESIRVHSDLD